MKCRNCGFENDEDSPFCVKCGSFFPKKNNTQKDTPKKESKKQIKEKSNIDNIERSNSNNKNDINVNKSSDVSKEDSTTSLGDAVDNSSNKENVTVEKSQNSNFGVNPDSNIKHNQDNTKQNDSSQQAFTKEQSDFNQTVDYNSNMNYNQNDTHTFYDDNLSYQEVEQINKDIKQTTIKSFTGEINILAIIVGLIITTVVGIINYNFTIAIILGAFITGLFIDGRGKIAIFNGLVLGLLTTIVVVTVHSYWFFYFYSNVELAFVFLSDILIQVSLSVIFVIIGSVIHYSIKQNLT